jgi:hypothetical protein
MYVSLNFLYGCFVWLGIAKLEKFVRVTVSGLLFVSGQSTLYTLVSFASYLGIGEW